MKSIFVASVLNFLVWGSGYYYLDKRDLKGYAAFALYVIILISSTFFILTASPLILPVLFWIILLSMWFSIYLVYDTLRKPKPKLKLSKIEKVRKVVHRHKVRTRKK